MKLDIYKLFEHTPEIVPARSRRDWMDAFPDRHPYRCLPLTMANSTGWEILCPLSFKAEWDGGPLEENIEIWTHDEWPPLSSFADSHFRRGVLTFHTGHLFRTPPGWAVWVSGPPNAPKDGISPLTGLVETDWLPFPFTMNWIFTRPGRVEFQKGEPFAFVTLMEHHKLEEIEPDLRLIDDNPDLKQDYEDWSKSRGGLQRKAVTERGERCKERVAKTLYER